MVETFMPSEVLRPYISSYKIISSIDGVTNRLLPDTAAAMGIRISGDVNYIENGDIVRLPRAVVSGLRKSVRLVQYSPGSAMLIVSFKQDGAAAFFREPVSQIFEQSVGLENVMDVNAVKFIEEAIAASQTIPERIRAIDKFMVSKLRPGSPDRLVERAIESIRRTKGMIRIAELAKDLYISEDAFSKRFQKITGSTAKQFASIIRMKSVIETVQVSDSFTDTALEAGFYDQAHFNKEFKIFTGLSPAAFLRNARQW